VVADISASSQARATSVEVVLLSERDGVLRYRVRRDVLEDGVHPDDLALGLAGLSLCTPGALLHSTSWRHENDTLVLTYAALPDLWPQSTRRVEVDAMAVAASPLMPSPCTVDIEAVAAHACRHLALLLTSDPVAIDAAAAAPALWTLIGKLPAAPAGALRDLAR
jgi:hypothetical protein